MSGSVPLRHEYAFMAWTGTTLPSWLGQAQRYLHGLDRHNFTFILEDSAAKKLHLKFQLITKRTF